MKANPNILMTRWIIHHRAASIVAVLLLGGGLYYGAQKLFSSEAPPRYVLARVERGTVVASVSGTGQVSALTEVEVQPKVSGDATYVPVREGDSVKAGALLVQLDLADAQKAVRDAETNLRSSQISLEKLQKPADAISLTQAENALADAVRAKQKAEEDLIKAYEDGFTAVANAFIDVPNLISGFDTILNGTTLNGNQTNAYAYYDFVKSSKANAAEVRDAALASFKLARAAYDANLDHYKKTSRYSDRAAIEALIDESYEMLKALSDAVKNAKNFLDLVNDAFAGNSNARPPSLLATHESSLQSYIGTTNSHLGSTLSIRAAIQNDKEGVSNAARSIREKTESLAKLKSGADPLDVESQKLSIVQRENSLKDARAALANYSVRAPFGGIVAKLNVKKGDSVSPGTSVATLITPQQTVAISLNEVDVGKVRLGAKATLAFDALPDLAMTGKVVQIDALGTVTQGVVNYGVTIALDMQDERVKPGMSVSATVVTEVKQDVLMVPNAAVKSQGGASYVEVAEGESAGVAGNGNQGVSLAAPPRQQAVHTGLSNDTVAEITSGLAEGDMVVAREVSGLSQSAVTQQGSAFRLPGASGGGGMFFRR